MGLALSSSHHYSSQPRVRAQSDRHSTSNTLKLILVYGFFFFFFSLKSKDKVTEILTRACLQAIIVLGFFPFWDSPTSMWKGWCCTPKALLPASPKASPFHTYAINQSFLCVLCITETCIDTQLFYFFLTNTQERLQTLQYESSIYMFGLVYLVHLTLLRFVILKMDWDKCRLLPCSLQNLSDNLGNAFIGEKIYHLTVQVWHGWPIIILHMWVKWGVIIGLSCTSTHALTTLSAQFGLKAKTLSRTSHLKPSLMHLHFKVTEMTVWEALWSKIIPYFCLHKWFMKG